ncbi:hypothetical protein GCM10011505_47270 [Tistrella bauzanensis]|uniref:DUF2946 domain-containing protein n=2 Tax=Tistrella bauzanensis TaxID=657419 RepID=A0ABQ1J8I3_9PROT|nr:hypothetical protein GCM10011505_47270 [Tistrella bauzanensis]
MVLLLAALAQMMGVIAHAPMALAMVLSPGQVLEICSPTASDSRPDDRGAVPGAVCHDCLAAQAAMPPAEPAPLPLPAMRQAGPDRPWPASPVDITAAVSPAPARAPPVFAG